MTPLDTSKTANDIQMLILRKKTGVERLQIAIDLSDLARKLTIARIEQEQPGLSKALLIREFLRWRPRRRQLKLSLDDGELHLGRTFDADSQPVHR